MPATAGRVRLPHNNRMTTSSTLKTSSIWKAIGHDPHASEAEKIEAAANADNEAKARGLLELARHQNVAGRDGSRDDFAKKMYLGLKPGKKRRTDLGKAQANETTPYELLDHDSSSSEEEFVEVEEEAKKSGKSSSKDKSRKKHRKRKDRKRKRSRRHSSSSEEGDESSSDDSSRRERRRKRRRRKDKKRKKKRRKSHDSSSSDSD